MSAATPYLSTPSGVDAELGIWGYSGYLVGGSEPPVRHQASTPEQREETP